MSHACADITFAPAVRKGQSPMGSRERLTALDRMLDRNRQPGPREAEFIAARDSFYQAAVSETGWP